MDINSYFPDEKEDDGPYARKGQFSQTIPGAPPERPAAVLNVSDSAQRDVTFRHQSLPPMNAGSVAVLPLSGKPAPNSLPGSHSLSPSPMQGFVPLIPSNGSATLRQSPSVPNLGVTSSGGFHKTHSRHSSLTGGTTFHPSHTRNASLGSVGMNDANAINAANADITPMPAPPPISHLSTSSSIRSNRAALRRVKPSFAPHPEQTPGQQNPQQPFFGYPQPQMQQSYGSAASNEFNAQTGVYNLEASYVPVDHHWFYCKKDPTGKEIWNPFSKKDSTLLEEAYIKGIHYKLEILQHSVVINGFNLGKLESNGKLVGRRKGFFNTDQKRKQSECLPTYEDIWLSSGDVKSDSNCNLSVNFKIKSN
ncbi:hypothetical protein QYM36_012637 [Artemia franciscana]|uniref:WWE domain-containing protein n=1 Tax=Artemia franciscana TaxID=6661 RepID=A0AA88L823_ARTSF|nr:hypothetical protein QYM36_012637 [Artemia franciscana]